MPSRVLLCGYPGVGKSTLAANLVRGLARQGQGVCGFLTREQVRDGLRIGFRVQDDRGSEATIAHIDLDSPVRVGRFGVDIPAFERIALPALRRGLDSRTLIIIDEIARMELASEAFAGLVTEAFDGAASVVATVHVHPHPFTDALKRRPDVELIEVTPENRDALPAMLVERLTQQ